MKLERVVSNTLTRPGKRHAGLIAAVTLCMFAGAVASGCSDADREDIGSPAGSVSSPDRTSEKGGAPPGTPLYTEVFSVIDAAVLDGNWFVLDGRGRQVHRISPEGELLHTFGRAGSGPGEFGFAEAIVAHGDSIMVVDDGILHVFSPGGEHIVDRRVQLGPAFDCLTAMVQVSDAVSTPAGLLLLLHCMGRDARSTTHAAIETGEGFVRSLARLNAEAGDVFDFVGVFAVISDHPRGFVFGSASDQCLSLFSPSGGKLDEVCHDWLERPEMPQEMARQLEGSGERARRAGGRIRIPETLPPFLGVSVTAGGRLVYLGPAPGDAEAETLALFTLGNAGQRVVLQAPEAPVMVQDGTRILAAWDELDGTRIALLTLDGLDTNQ